MATDPAERFEDLYGLAYMMLTDGSTPLPRLSDPGQLLLHPTPMELCHEVGLTDEIIDESLSKGWLTADPRTAKHLTVGLRAELECVGRAFTFGPKRAKELLGELDRPFHYALDEIYFDLLHQKWRSVADTVRMLIAVHAPPSAYKELGAYFMKRALTMPEHVDLLHPSPVLAFLRHEWSDEVVKAANEFYEREEWAWTLVNMFWKGVCG